MGWTVTSLFFSLPVFIGFTIILFSLIVIWYNENYLNGDVPKNHLITWCWVGLAMIVFGFIATVQNFNKIIKLINANIRVRKNCSLFQEDNALNAFNTQVERLTSKEEIEDALSNPAEFKKSSPRKDAFPTDERSLFRDQQAKEEELRRYQLGLLEAKQNLDRREALLREESARRGLSGLSGRTDRSMQSLFGNPDELSRRAQEESRRAYEESRKALEESRKAIEESRRAGLSAQREQTVGRPLVPPQLGPQQQQQQLLIPPQVPAGFA